MAIRKIAVTGDEILRKTSKPVKKINDRVKQLCGDMAETMIAADGVGLAAPQVSVLKRIFVARPELEDQDKVYVMINPEMVSKEGEQDSTEGCLSVPGYMGFVKRPETIKIRATDINGEEKEYEFSDFAAVVMCHEYEHLDGILYTDKTEKLLTNEEFEELLEKEAAEKEAAAQKKGNDD